MIGGYILNNGMLEWRDKTFWCPGKTPYICIINQICMYNVRRLMIFNTREGPERDSS